MADLFTTSNGGAFTNFTTGSVVTSNINDVNVLNSYRSYTYNFTFSAITAADLNTPTKWRNGQTGLVILQSGGKGITGLTSPGGPTQRQVDDANQPVYDSAEEAAARKKQIAETNTAILAPSVVSGFNKSSPGRFDMFIDKVEMPSWLVPHKNSGQTVASTVNFTVVEPYSINGFIEALHAASLAAGYYHYTKATFMLTIKFMGYPDGPNLPSAQEVPNATRSFPITLKRVKMEITEKGTVYRVEAVIATDEASADSNNKLKKAITFEGDTIQEALAGPIPAPADYAGTSFVDRLNEMQKEAVLDRSRGVVYNEYRILFPEVDETTGKLDYTKVNKIGQTLIAEPSLRQKDGSFMDVSETKECTAYQNAPDNQHPEIRLDPSTKKFTLQFSQNTNITDVIANTIRDSEYINKILKNIKNNIDKYGFVDYFIIRLEIETTKDLNPETQLPKQIFKYVVTPYKVHYTTISVLQPLTFVPENYKKSTIREYNYIYTGKNVDIINFKMNFDSQFYQAMPFEVNNDVVLSSNSAGPGNSVDVSKNIDKEGMFTEVGSNQNAPTIPKPTSADYVPVDGSGGPKSDDPYRNLSRFVHLALLNVADAAQAKGELEILGDPIYLTTGGKGNYNPELADKGITVDGEAAVMSGQVLIRINFRNPIDILPFAKGGLYEFNEDLVPFSGIYLITKINNVFSDGIFKQRLEITRMPGQVEQSAPKPQKANDLQNILKQTPNPEDQTTTNSTDAKPVQAGQVSADVLKRLGVAVQTNLGTAATAVAAAAILKSITGKNSAAIAGAIVAGGGLTVAKNLLATASTLGSTPIAKLVGGSGAAVAATSNVAPTIPDPTDVQSRANDGVAVELLDTKTIANLPPSAPKSIAPDAPPDQAMLETIAREGGPQALAKAYGVKDVSQIASNLVPPDILKIALAAVPAVIANPFDYVKKVLANTVDTTVITNKIESASTLVAGATTVNIIPKDATQVTSVGNQFGSNSSGNSPLDKIYTG